MKSVVSVLLFSTLLTATAAIAAGASAAATDSAPPAAMRAIQFEAYGPSSVLSLVSLARPKPEAGEVLVRIDAAGVNTIDWEARKEAMLGPKVTLPIVPGYDFVGEIVQLGEGVKGHALGERVYAMLPLDQPRAYAEYVRVPAEVIALAPRKLDAVHAAAAPMVALTAWQALFDAGGLKRGQTVLIHGAAGGVGHMALQLAKHTGARVIGTASASNLDLLRKLGADEVVDYKTQKFEDVVHDVDLVFDTVGGETLQRSYQVLHKGGTLVSIAGRVDKKKAAELGIQVKGIIVHPDAAQLTQVATLLDSGEVHTEIDTVYPLQDAKLAHDKSETRHLHGRLVLKIRDDATAKR